MSRALSWDGCINVRDLGGLPTENGGATRFGSVVRGDRPSRLTDDGWRALAAHGIRRVLDLRAAEELGDEPPPRAAVDVVRVPLMGEQDAAYLLLRLAGVVDDAIADDYAVGAPREAMLGLLAELDRRWGGAEDYLREAGLDDAQLARLRERLR